MKMSDDGDDTEEKAVNRVAQKYFDSYNPPPKKTKANNKHLNAAKVTQDDEYYTRMSTITAELTHYEHLFKGKKIVCNCDDPYCSNFSKYFVRNFEYLGLKKLTTTCYRNDRIDLFSTNSTESAICMEYEGGNPLAVPSELPVRKLAGNGDFRSPECVEFLKDTDVVVVTNPPFTLFRQFVKLLLKLGVKFLIIGPYSAVGNVDFWPLIKSGKVRIGISQRGMVFDRADGSEQSINSVWYTNLPHARKIPKIELVFEYKGSEGNYPKYDNYDAIEVPAVKHIPKDYDGEIGVPITYMCKHNPKQFEIVGNEYDLNIPKGRFYLKGRRLPARVVIKLRKG